MRIKKSIAFTPYNRDTFYLKGSPVGYIDYPFADKEAEEHYRNPPPVIKANSPGPSKDTGVSATGAAAASSNTGDGNGNGNGTGLVGRLRRLSRFLNMSA